MSRSSCKRDCVLARCSRSRRRSARALTCWRRVKGHEDSIRRRADAFRTIEQDLWDDANSPNLATWYAVWQRLPGIEADSNATFGELTLAGASLDQAEVYMSLAWKRLNQWKKDTNSCEGFLELDVLDMSEEQYEAYMSLMYGSVISE